MVSGRNRSPRRSFAYVTRLNTMDALAAGLLGEDAPGDRFVDLIARWEAHRARDAELQARTEAWRAAFRARHVARQEAQRRSP